MDNYNDFIDKWAPENLSSKLEFVNDFYYVLEKVVKVHSEEIKSAMDEALNKCVIEYCKKYGDNPSDNLSESN
jgi:hypothetical protein